MEKSFKIIPFKKVGCIAFNMNRDAVRKKNGDYTEFRKTKFSKNTTDDFGDFHVFYSIDNTVDAVELFPTSKVTYNNRNLFQLNKVDIIELFNDIELKEEFDSLIFPNFGIEITIEDTRVTSVFVHKKDY